MPLIKIWSHDRKIKKLIQANSLNMVTEEGAVKLGYGKEIRCRVVIESDGTDIDSEEIFSAILAENMFSKTILMLLPEDKSWSDANSIPAVSLPAVPQLGDATSILDVSLPLVPQPGPSRSSNPGPSEIMNDASAFFCIPYHDFPKKMIADCGKNKIPEKRLIRKMIQNVAKALIKFNPLPERALIRVVAQEIVGKYPVLGSPNTVESHKSYETIFTKLENCVHNLRRPIKLLEKVYSKTSNSLAKRPKKDQYGCIKWQPILPESETVETQEIARKSLVDMSNITTSDESTISAMMCQTYATQRLMINSKESVESIEKSWPYLFRTPFFYLHTSELLGINLISVWSNSLSKLPSLISYFRSLRKKNEKIDKILIQMEEAVVRQKNRTPESSALMLLLLCYFGEEESQIFSYFDVATSLEEIRSRIQNKHPSICILGNSLFNDCKGYVLVENVVVGDLEEISDLVPIFFASYYVFNLCYPAGAEATLEFLQREFFNINPPGHKRGGKKKRTTVHPKVSTLQLNLQHHTSQWGQVDEESDPDST